MPEADSQGTRKCWQVFVVGSISTDGFFSESNSSSYAPTFSFRGLVSARRRERTLRGADRKRVATLARDARLDGVHRFAYGHFRMPSAIHAADGWSLEVPDLLQSHAPARARNSRRNVFFALNIPCGPGSIPEPLQLPNLPNL